MAGAALGIVTLLTHVIAPRVLTHYDGLPALAHAPKRTLNAKGFAADPLNIALVGSIGEVSEALRRAGWTSAEPVTRRSSARIAARGMARWGHV